MRTSFLLSTMGLIALAVGVALAADTPATKGTAAASSRVNDERLLRQSAVDFTTAYNAYDAKAIAAQFATYAEMVNDDGSAVQGKEAIEKAFAEQFAEQPGGKMAVEIESLRFLGDNLAVEDGRLALTKAGKEQPVYSHYSVLHVREGGQWLVASTRETIIPGEPLSAHEQLRQLEWMIGEWIDESPHAVVATSCRWDESKNFILRDYSVKVAGQEAMSGTQRIGWDPLSKQLKAWSFDSEGGYGEGFWRRDGNRWDLRLTGVSADGRIGSATQIHTFVSNHEMKWQAIDRVLGGESLPDIEEITIVRKAPKPL